MTHPIDRAAEVIARAQFGLTTPMMSRNIADDLHAAGLLVTPAHDAAVAAKELREAADEMRRSVEWAEDDSRVDDATRAAWRAVGNAFAMVNEVRADRIEGGSDV